jgi:hypothetical protein
LTGPPAGGLTPDSLQPVYSRRWKNTAVYGTSQVQTTICCIFDAFIGNEPENIGVLLWESPETLAHNGFWHLPAAKTV